MSLDTLAHWLAANAIDCLALSVADAFQGEEMQPCDRAIEYLTGFAGSAGALVVTAKDSPLGKGALLVDGRYTLKGREIADATGLALVELTAGALAETIRTMTPPGGTWAIDVDSLSSATTQDLIVALEAHASLKPVHNASFADWWPNRPAEHFAEIVPAHPLLSATSAKAKIDSVWQTVVAETPDLACLLVSDPAEIAWLLNMRGQDTQTLTTFRARLLIKDKAEVVLFRDAQSPCQPLPLKGVSKNHRPLDALPQALGEIRGKVRLCPATTPHALVQSIAPDRRVLKPSPIARLKSRKDSDEIEGMRQAHLADALAMVRFLYWLEQSVPGGGVDENSATQRLWAFRQEVGARTVSFATISAVGPNAALPHYRSTPETNRPLTMDQIYLVDSGGQYDQGTTDITRTVFFGAPDEALVRQNTLVLMGHIDLARARFPIGTTGHRLDTLARQHLWQAGLEYNHGTGHGVGAGLNVHESPPTIAPRPGPAMTAFESGMIVSNEPGYYQEGSHGIRIECLQVCQPDQELDGWLMFEVLTWVPLQAKLINPNMLSDDQLAWLNQFHATVLEKIESLLDPKEELEVILWLRQCCKPLSKTTF